MLGKVGTAVKLQWSLRMRCDWMTKISGQAANYTCTIWCDGVVSAVVGVVSEIGVSGEYLVTFTPTAEGHWVVECTNIVVGDVLDWDVQVYSATISEVGVSTTTITNTCSDIRANTEISFKQTGKYDERARKSWTNRATSTLEK
jgi:hypothetical protein